MVLTVIYVIIIINVNKISKPGLYRFLQMLSNNTKKKNKNKKLSIVELRGKDRCKIGASIRISESGN